MADDATDNMIFMQACLPALDAGDYRLTVSQELSESGQESLQPFVNPFSVRGPRFVLDPADIYSMFPSPGHEGKFGNCLPHIVFLRKSLPWERTLDGSLPVRPVNQDPSQVPPPWLCLLLFSDEEVPETKNLTVNDILNPPEGVAAAKITPDTAAGEKETDPCRIIDVPADLFAKIIPSKKELTYLAHAKSVDVSAKETSAAATSGIFSVVLGNRFPKSSIGGTKNTVHLVSLEGMAGYVPDNPGPFDPAISYIRLVSLADWSFTDTETLYNFEALAKNLSPARPLQFPVQKNGNAPEEKLAENALNMGYEALNHGIRNGENTVSWYRGPLVPLNLKQEQVPCDPCADAALKYDPDTGLFDVSHAAAWQIGRLLGLQNKSFATALYLWRRRNNQNAVLQSLFDTFKGRMKNALPDPDKEKCRTGGRMVREKMFKYLRDVLKTKLLFEKPADPTGLKGMQDKMPGLLSGEDFKEASSSGKDLYQAICDKIFKGKNK